MISLKRTHLIRVALTTLGIGLVLFGGLNYLAYKHARAMLCFGDSAGRTRRPEDLTFKEKTDAVFNGVSIPRPVSDRDPTELAPDTAVLAIASTDGATLAVGGLVYFTQRYSRHAERFLDHRPNYGAVVHD